MLQHYIEGQHDILEWMLEYLAGKQEAAIEAAREQGIDLGLDEENDWRSNSRSLATKSNIPGEGGKKMLGESVSPLSQQRRT
ncbi:hypothetical protein BU15DRAFT_75295 [Melanogaster broomeanus]|nr:hypothetical protein BU15DRAFT_75295 [Melanogaster broomeanus]